MIKKNMSIQELQAYVKKTDEERGFNTESASRCFIGMVEEIGEIAEAVKNLEKQNRGKSLDIRIDLELADVLYYLLSLSDKFGVDLGAAFIEKERKNNSREWQSAKK